MSKDREREGSSPTINLLELKKQLKLQYTPKITIKPQEPTKREFIRQNIPNEQKSTKSYACDTCKHCQEFEPRPNNSSLCLVCGCALISHLRDSEESPAEESDDDYYEWQDE